MGVLNQNESIPPKSNWIIAVCALLAVSVGAAVIVGVYKLRPTEPALPDESVKSVVTPIEIKADGPEAYIKISDHPSSYTVSSGVSVPEAPDDFDLLSDAWWQENVGRSSMDSGPNTVFDGNVIIDKDGAIIENAKFMGSAVQTVVRVRGGVGTISNSIIEASCAAENVSDGSVNILNIWNSTFVPGKVSRYAAAGMAVNARFNRITSDNDGINPLGGLSVPSSIEYNWFDGPGYVIGTNHMDGIQLWQEGYATIRRNRIGGFPNSCIIIKSDEKPRFGDEPIKNVLITENYFEDRGLSWYYLYVCEHKTNPDNYYQTRPQYITITNNWFQSKEFYPIYTGLEKSEAAIFVRTEEERDEGVRRQEVSPGVLEYRQSLGWSKSAVDARTWIVWDGNRYTEDGTEVRPTGDRKDNGWYDLTGERKWESE